MKLLQRLKNLWKLSVLEIADFQEIIETKKLSKKQQKGYIVKLQDDLSKLIEK